MTIDAKAIAATLEEGDMEKLFDRAVGGFVGYAIVLVGTTDMWSAGTAADYDFVFTTPSGRLP